MSAIPSPYIIPSYRFHGSSTNIVKDHFIEKKSISRRASQQLSQIIPKNKKSRSRVFLMMKILLILCSFVLLHIQFKQGSSINQLLYKNNFELDHGTMRFHSKKPLLHKVDLSKSKNELIDSILSLIVKNEPIFQEPITINKDKLDNLLKIKMSKDNEEVLTVNKLNEQHFIQLTEVQENTLANAHSSFFINLYSKMHNLIKMFHHNFEMGRSGIIIYNNYNMNFKESIIASRITIESIQKTNSQLPLQVIFHKVDDDDENDEEFKNLCFLNQVECIHLQSQSLRKKYSQLEDSILRKMAILVSNKFDKLVMLQSGSILLNEIDDLLKVENENNLIFWSELNDKRLTLPSFYTITDSNNIYGNKRQRIRAGKDETFKYFSPLSQDEDDENVLFHDLEDTLVDSTTDSSIVFIHKKVSLNIIILSMYYDFYNFIFYPLITAELPHQLLNPDSTNTLFQNITSSLFSMGHESNAFTETLLLSSFASNAKYYQVYKRQEPINNGVLNFNPIEDFKNLNKYYNSNLKALLPTSMEINAESSSSSSSSSAGFDPLLLDNFLNKDQSIKPLLLSGINYNEIFNKEKFFNNVFDHDFYLNNNEVDPDIILSDLFLSLKKTL